MRAFGLDGKLINDLRTASNADHKTVTCNQDLGILRDLVPYLGGLEG